MIHERNNLAKKREVGATVPLVQSMIYDRIS